MLTRHVYNLELPEELRPSVFTHELVHFSCAERSRTKAMLLSEALKGDSGIGYSHSFVEEYNAGLALLWEALAYYAQLRAPETPLLLAERLLSVREGWVRAVIELVYKIDSFASTLISRTRFVDVNPHGLVWMELARGIRTLERAGVGVSDVCRRVEALLETPLDEFPDFRSSEEWEDLFRAKLLGGTPAPGGVSPQILVSDSLSLWGLLRRIAEEGELDSVKPYVFGVVEEFGVATPVVAHEVDSLYEPRRVKIDVCIIPSEGESYIHELTEYAEKFWPEDASASRAAFREFLRGLAAVQPLVWKCRGRICRGRGECELKGKVYEALRGVL